MVLVLKLNPKVLPKVMVESMAKLVQSQVEYHPHQTSMVNHKLMQLVLLMPKLLEDSTMLLKPPQILKLV